MNAIILNELSNTLKAGITAAQTVIEEKKAEIIRLEQTLQPIRHSLSAINTMAKEMTDSQSEINKLDKVKDADKITKLTRNIDSLANNTAQEFKRINEYCKSKQLL